MTDNGGGGGDGRDDHGGGRDPGEVTPDARFPLSAPDPDGAPTDTDVDPENPRPAGHLGRFRSSTWH